MCEFYLNILTYYSYSVSADASELAGYRLNWLDATDKSALMGHLSIIRVGGRVTQCVILFVLCCFCVPIVCY